MEHCDRSKKEKKQWNWWCAACSQYNWKDPNSVSVIQDGADPSEAKVFRVRATSRSVPESYACSQIPDQIVNRRGQLGGPDLRRFAGAEQVGNHE